MLSVDGQMFFIRLINVVDDFGLYYGHPELIRSAAYPFGNVSAVAIRKMLDELCHARMLHLYTADDGRPYLHLVNWLKFNKPRNLKPKYPMPSYMRTGGKGQPAPEDLDCEVPGDPPAPPDKPKQLQATAIKCPHQQIADLWNEIAVGRPKVEALTMKRKKAVEDIFRANGESVDPFRRIFGKVAKSDFLMGKTASWSGATFDWVMKPDNWVKISEGNYDGTAKKPTPPSGGGKHPANAGNFAQREYDTDFLNSFYEPVPTSE